jgi:tRNA-binding protein
LAGFQIHPDAAGQRLWEAGMSISDRFSRTRKVTGMMESIEWRDFEKVELRVGRILSADVFEKARKPAYVLHVDFGDAIGIKKSSAQITALYSLDDLVGKLVVAVVNFPKKQIGPLMSECLVTGFHDANGDVVLCVPDRPVPLGEKLL